jgi:glucose uptake protein GlcU
LPQIIIAYAMMDIFIYNIYDKTLPSLLGFTILVMLAGGIILAVYFTRAVRQSKKLKKEKSSGSEFDVRK